ncbi:MAG: hypothetical protein AMJ78_06570 [Omnitrophica WOR_2 bacterium SM23_29]|nr:MAG: hypothetical protein AMJ78_06570 [Omnitrophica WOR_2 bacterium SM23_29]
MANLKKTLFWALIGVVFFFCKGQTAIGEERALPRNVRIDVEFKEYGETERGILSGTWQENKSSQYTKQFIVVSDGLSASIFVGQKVPYVSYYRMYLYDGGYIEKDITIKEVGTKLKVTPKIIGDMVEITLTPQISYVSGTKRGTIDIKTLTTTVLVKDGRSLEIGGLQKDAEFERYFFTSSSQSNLKIILTPRIE